MKMITAALKSSVHVPVSVDGVPSNVNFWSAQVKAFPEESFPLLQSLAAEVVSKEVAIGGCLKISRCERMSDARASGRTFGWPSRPIDSAQGRPAQRRRVRDRRLVQRSKSGGRYSQSSLWCNHMGSAFLAMSSSMGKPSINSGRGTRFCLPLMKIVVNFFFRSRRARLSAAVNLRFRFFTAL